MGDKPIYSDNHYLDEYRDIYYIDLSDQIHRIYINLSPLSKITTIGCHFMNYCTSLTSIDLSKLTQFTRICSSFMCHCTNLTSINLSGITQLTHIG